MRDQVKFRIFINYLDELTRKYDEIFSLKEQLMRELEERATYDLLSSFASSLSKKSKRAYLL